MSLTAADVRTSSNAEEVMELLVIMAIVEREEEMSTTEREDAWGLGIPIRQQPMPHSPVLPSHLTPTSL